MNRQHRDPAANLAVGHQIARREPADLNAVAAVDLLLCDGNDLVVALKRDEAVVSRS